MPQEETDGFSESRTDSMKKETYSSGKTGGGFEKPLYNMKTPIISNEAPGRKLHGTSL